MLDGPWGPIELWEAFGPTYPCIPRERIGDVLDGGKWCGLRVRVKASCCLLPAARSVLDSCCRLIEILSAAVPGC